jgi:hypothetical protein
MTKRLIAPGAVALLLGLAACTNPYDPAQRAVGGGLIGAGAGAAIGAAAGGGTGAAIGAATGGALGDYPAAARLLPAASTTPALLPLRRDYRRLAARGIAAGGHRRFGARVLGKGRRRDKAADLGGEQPGEFDRCQILAFRADELAADR